MIVKLTGVTGGEGDLPLLRLIVDDIRSDTEATVAMIQELCGQKGWSFLLALSGVFVAETLAQAESCKHINFYAIQPWGPSKIREMAVRLFEKTGIDVNLVYESVRRSLEEYDLPATPTTVSLYMSLLAKAGGAISGISFLRLLEQIEESRIGTSENPPTDTKYYRQQILDRIAEAMLRQNADFLSPVQVKQIIAERFAGKLLAFDADLILSGLIRSGILIVREENIEFVHFVFLDYYLARAILAGNLAELEFATTLEQCVRLTYALALFAGMKRDNCALGKRLLGAIEARFPEPEERDLKALDEHIKDLIAPGFEEGVTPDSIASGDLDKKVDYEAMDDQYERKRSAVPAKRRKLIRQGTNISLDEISTRISSLSAFYSIFKNLEDIDGKEKTHFLDRILDLHIQTNFALIDLAHAKIKDEDFRTVVAYLVTWSGQGFMAAALGNQALCEAIKVCVRQTKNDFKELLLILLLSDIADPESLIEIDRFLEKTKSISSIEILFFHLRQRMVKHETRVIPKDLVSTFKKAFERRQEFYKSTKTKGALKALFEKTLAETENEHRAVQAAAEKGS